MRIEIFAGGGGSVTQFQSSLNNLHRDISSTIDSLQTIKHKLNNITGGTGNLSSAAAHIQTRIRSEEIKCDTVHDLSRSTQEFLENTVQTDSQVALLVTQSQEEFFRDYTWLRPKAAVEKSWWEQRVEDWNRLWESADAGFNNMLAGIVDWVKDHAVELIVGTAAVIIGAAIMAFTGGTGAALLVALAAGVKAAAVSAVISGVMGGIIAGFTGGDVLRAFGDGIASGFMWGGIFFAFSSMVTAIRTAASAKKPMTKGERAKANKKMGDEFENDLFKKYSKKTRDAKSQITIQTSSGTKTKVDFIGFDKENRIIIKEFKSTLRARLTKNQEKAFAEILENGGIVKGAGKGPFKDGFRIPAGTVVDVIRPSMDYPVLKQLVFNTNFSSIFGGLIGTDCSRLILAD